MAAQMRATVASMLKGIDSYQFNPVDYKADVVIRILLKALTNLPHTDFVLCKCLLETQATSNKDIEKIINLHDLLETCQFSAFWVELNKSYNLISNNIGFDDSIRKFICHVVNITYQHIEKQVLSSLLGGLQEAELLQWMHKYGWKQLPNGLIFIANQEENVKTKNITEKIDFDSVAAIMATSR